MQDVYAIRHKTTLHNPSCSLLSAILGAAPQREPLQFALSWNRSGSYLLRMLPAGIQRAQPAERLGTIRFRPPRRCAETAGEDTPSPYNIPHPPLTTIIPTHPNRPTDKSNTFFGALLFRMRICHKLLATSKMSRALVDERPHCRVVIIQTHGGLGLAGVYLPFYYHRLGCIGVVSPRPPSCLYSRATCRGID